MKGTRSEWIEKAKAAASAPFGVSWDGLANLAEEHGGPFEPEPPAVEVVWEAAKEDVPGSWVGVRILSDGTAQINDVAGVERWRPYGPLSPLEKEATRRLLAEWRARQGPGDWADAAAREFFASPGMPASAALAAILRRHAGESANAADNALLIANALLAQSLHEADAKNAALQAKLSGIVGRLRDAATVADAIERGERSK